MGVGEYLRERLLRWLVTDAPSPAPVVAAPPAVPGAPPDPPEITRLAHLYTEMADVLRTQVAAQLDASSAAAGTRQLVASSSIAPTYPPRDGVGTTSCLAV
jgi:hypothetical protein